MKKVIAISSVLLGAIFLAGCGQQPINQTQPTVPTPASQNSTTNQPSTASVKNKIAADFVCGTSQTKDADGNTYGTVLIGTQCWMTSNMNLGEQIDGTTEPTDNQKIEKWCYDNEESNCDSYGGLYSWDEAMQYSTKEGAQGICPSGWHIPTDAEQYILENYLEDLGETCDAISDGTSDCAYASTKLKSGGSSGFEGLLAGFRSTGSTDGPFYVLGSIAYFWSSSQSGTSAWHRSLGSSDYVFRYLGAKANGFSVRCLKD